MRFPPSQGLALLVLCLFALASPLPSEDRGLLAVRTKDGREVGGFKASYALVIGESRYTMGWPELPGVSTDVDLVSSALETAGFKVSAKRDLSFTQLKAAFEDFIGEYGLERDNRLLFYYAGHGHTLKISENRDMGYIVPIDAPKPQGDSTAFKRMAIPMQQFETWAKTIESRHALFVFDSCFSGSLFKLRGTSDIPDNVSEKTMSAVRQFITSGSADEAVPDASIFRAEFLEGIGGAADRNGDGYVTGAELGEFLDERVVNYTKKKQHPQCGKIVDVDLDKGDFVFAVSWKGPRPGAPDEKAPKVFGRLVVSSFREGELFVDGVKKCDLPPSDERRFDDIEEGAHEIKLRYEGGIEEPKKVTLSKSDSSSLSFEWGKAPPGFAFLPGGRFAMGSPSSEEGREKEEIQHEVTLGPFSICSRDLSVGEFRAFASATGYRTSAEVEGTGKVFSGGYWADKVGATWRDPEFYQSDDHPAVLVSWYDALAYCNWRSESEGRQPVYAYKGERDFRKWPAGWNVKAHNEMSCDFSAAGYRLPTEAEWEFAAKGGVAEGASASGLKGHGAGPLLSTKAIFAGSENPGDVAWYTRNSGDKTHAAGLKKPNSLGLYDMAGNVWQWCWDLMGEYPVTAQIDPRGPGSGSGRVLRGGAWNSSAAHVRSAYRSYNDPWSRCSNRGFRLALSNPGM